MSLDFSSLQNAISQLDKSLRYANSLMASWRRPDICMSVFP